MMTNLQRLKKNAAQFDVKLVRIMVDDEGNMAAIDKQERMQSAVAHRKWVDIAHYLGCDDIRCNMRGGMPDWKQDKDLVKRAAEPRSPSTPAVWTQHHREPRRLRRTPMSWCR
jgi:hypothetical protein